MLKCCNKSPKWVENVRDKGYFFCEVCRNEVTERKEDLPDFNDWYSSPPSFDPTFKSSRNITKNYSQDDFDQELQDALDSLSKGSP